VDILLDGRGELERIYRSVDWANTPVGPIASWSDLLRNTVDLMLNTRFPVTLLWGSESVLLYNEAYAPLILDKHPAALGRPAREVFPEAWDFIGPLTARVMEGGGATWFEDRYVPLHRRGFLEECYFTFSYSPVRGRDGTVEGVIDIATETTEHVISRRRLHLLSRLNEQLADIDRLADIRHRALPVLRDSRQDFPAVDIRLPGTAAERSPGLSSRPAELTPPRSEVVETRGDSVVAWLPLNASTAAERSSLVVQLSPKLAPDEHYLGFLRLVAASLRQAIDRVRSRCAERRVARAQREMSEAFQRSLLPQPLRSGRPDVAVRYQPAAEVTQIGGDWYDLFELPDGSLMVVIGDVAGHDQEAAAAMAEVRNMSRGIAHTMQSDSPSQVLEGLDRAIYGSARHIVATAVLAQVTGRESDTPTLTWSNAGHLPPVLIDPGGRPRLLETPPDLLLGLPNSIRRTDHSLALQPGATVVLYTDGLVERRGSSLSDGLGRLVEMLRDHHDTDVEKLCDHLLRTATSADDDIALLVLRA
jgi:serine phosphatase RsbU (regulator of sigma subunit)